MDDGNNAQRRLRNRSGRFRRWFLIGAGMLFFALLVLVPLVNVFIQAFAQGWSGFVNALTTEDAQSAIGLTLKVTAIAVPVNTVFGLVAAWLLSRDRFRGQWLVSALVDVPFTVSPIIAGMLILFVYSTTIGLLAPWVNRWDLKIIYAWPGITLATIFVTLPHVARALVPVWQNLDRSEEEAAGMLGASKWQAFRFVVFPTIRWALMYGVIITMARAAGEYGATSVVSGKLINETNTITLHVERCYAEYQNVEAFSNAAALTSVAVIVLVAQMVLLRVSKR